MTMAFELFQALQGAGIAAHQMQNPSAVVEYWEWEADARKVQAACGMYGRKALVAQRWHHSPEWEIVTPEGSRLLAAPTFADLVLELAQAIRELDTARWA